MTFTYNKMGSKEILLILSIFWDISFRTAICFFFCFKSLIPESNKKMFSLSGDFCTMERLKGIRANYVLETS